MKYLCLKCGEVYDEQPQKQTTYINKRSGLKEKWVSCPKRICYGNVIEIDEFMVDIIKILNKKGYPTNFCCGGHIGYPNFYISFKEPFYNIEKICDNKRGIGLPEGSYICDVMKEKFIIRKELEGRNDIETTKNILENYIVLLDWVEKLPDKTREVN